MVSAVIDKYVPVHSANNNTVNFTTGDDSTSQSQPFRFCGGSDAYSIRDPQEMLNVALALTFLVGFCQVIIANKNVNTVISIVITLNLDMFRYFTYGFLSRLSF